MYKEQLKENLDKYKKEIQNYVVDSNLALELIDSPVLRNNIKSEINGQKKYFYDITKNRPNEIAGAFLEEGTSKDLNRRVNISDSYPESRIEEDNWEYNRHSEVEKEATGNVFSLGKRGFNLVVWISPDDGGDVYKEGRLNVEFPVFGENEWSFYGRHVPLTYNEIESFKLAQRLLKNGGISMESIVDIKDVRQQPIGFKINESSDWIKKCKKLMPEFMNIWDFIESGDDIKNKIKVEKDVMIAMEKADGNNHLFESIMATMGNEINADGGHGSSWNGGVEMVGMIVSINEKGEISYRLGRVDDLTFCKKCGCYYSGESCPNPRCKR